ncbi:MAG: hypothetical protein GC159_10540 [Phycisphaera sp.]|nr:hypothetical protein [Phycisphaera sp.]
MSKRKKRPSNASADAGGKDVTPAVASPPAAEPSLGRPSRAFRTTELIVLALPIVWMIVAGFLVETEYYDGWDTICNARRFTGRSQMMIYNRNPMMMALLAPAEFAHKAGGFHTMDARPYHVEMAMLHAAYLLLTWLGLVRLFGRSWPTLLAYIAAVPCFMFFEYAPFVSHDILSGVLLLGMVIAADALRRKWCWGWWTLLIVLGAFAPLIKHIYATFWVFLVIAHIIVTLLPAAPDEHVEHGGVADDRGFDANAAPSRFRLIGMLILGAFISGAITWLGMAVAFTFPGDKEPLLTLPLKQLEFLFSVHGNTGMFPWWVYLRNAPAYGLLTTLLIVPGIVIAWRRGGYALRVAAIIWVLTVAIMQYIAYREVRYLLCLTPLSAMLLVPILRTLVVDRRWFNAAVALLVVGLVPGYPYSILANMLRVTEPFYQHSEARDLLQPLEHHGETQRPPLLWYMRLFSSSPPGGSPLAGDRYNRNFHLAHMHILTLYGYQPSQLKMFEPAKVEPDLIPWPPGAQMIYGTDGWLVNPVSLWPEMPETRPTLVQFVGRDFALPLAPAGDAHYTLPNGSTLAITVAPDADGKPVVTIVSAALTQLLTGRNTYMGMLRLHIDGVPNPLVLHAVGPDRYTVPGMSVWPAGASARALAIHAFGLERAMSYPSPDAGAVIASPDEFVK